MKAKVIIAQATAETAEALYGLVKKMVGYNSNQGLSQCRLSGSFLFS